MSIYVEILCLCAVSSFSSIINFKLGVLPVSFVVIIDIINITQGRGGFQNDEGEGRLANHDVIKKS